MKVCKNLLPKVSNYYIRWDVGAAQLFPLKFSVRSYFIPPEDFTFTRMWSRAGIFMAAITSSTEALRGILRDTKLWSCRKTFCNTTKKNV